MDTARSQPGECEGNRVMFLNRVVGLPEKKRHLKKYVQKVREQGPPHTHPPAHLCSFCCKYLSYISKRKMACSLYQQETGQYEKRRKDQDKRNYSVLNTP